MAAQGFLLIASFLLVLLGSPDRWGCGWRG